MIEKKVLGFGKKETQGVILASSHLVNNELLSPFRKTN